MVALMRFTKNICRFLGIISEGPGEQQQEEMECGVRAQNSQDDLLSQDILNGEEGLSEEERARRRAERRRAKRKRQRERKKMERVEKNESAEEQGTEDKEGHTELESEESENDEEEEVVEEEQVAVQYCKDRTAPLLVAFGNQSNQTAQLSSCEEEPEWDVSSAFVANAASHIRPKGRTKSGSGSKENKENEARTGERRESGWCRRGSMLMPSASLQRQSTTSPTITGFFGNRSYCYACLDQYAMALSDAERSIQLAPDWPKGYFRKGSALMGLKRYREAEKAMEQVLRLDNDCEEARNDLFTCRVLQLVELGFEEPQSVLLLKKFSTVKAVLSSLEVAKGDDLDPLQDQSGAPCPSLWVGNVTVDLTEKQLRDLFKTCGEIDSIRVLHERFCAFVNFKNANMAARALETLQGKEIENTRLVIRYPDRRPLRAPPSPLRTAPCVAPLVSQQAAAAGPRRQGPINGNECYFWRTTGCHFGDKCRYKHIPEQQGRDRKPWQP
ncbi:hsp70-Hsp90 organizing protein isoform X4 [Anguilla anguilla]|uniref:hsp70-Hsp90 organizing protein isoform X4 n=1 Tax=Anguilla anguilla TaxID=7936 RepID=UPI0015A8611F|nr:hsp70-Hsp90 organizing protein isoform X4 [Anguilla anguilla]